MKTSVFVNYILNLFYCIKYLHHHNLKGRSFSFSPRTGVHCKTEKKLMCVTLKKKTPFKNLAFTVKAEIYRLQPTGKEKQTCLLVRTLTFLNMFFWSQGIMWFRVKVGSLPISLLNHYY